MIQIPGAVLVRLEAYLEDASSNLNQFGLILSETLLLFMELLLANIPSNKF